MSYLIVAWWCRMVSFGSTLAQVIACWLTAQDTTWTNADVSLVSFCSIHWRAISQWVPRLLCILSKEFENYPFKIITTSPRGQWVKLIGLQDKIWEVTYPFIQSNSTVGLHNNLFNKISTCTVEPCSTLKMLNCLKITTDTFTFWIIYWIRLDPSRRN